MLKPWYRLSYSEVRSCIVATATHKDGYNGHNCKIGIALHPQCKVPIAVYSSGTFKLSDQSFALASDLINTLKSNPVSVNSSLLSVDSTIDQEFVDGLPIG